MLYALIHSGSDGESRTDLAWGNLRQLRTLKI